MDALAPSKILVVHDTDPRRGILHRVLSAAGFVVEQASTPAEALERARTHPDLIVLDVQRPDVDSFELCRQIKAEPAAATIPVVHLTHAARAEHTRAALESAADTYLPSPAEPSEILATIGALLRVRGAEAAARQASATARLLIDAAPTLILAVDADGRIALFNPACEALSGAALAEVVGCPIGVVIPEASARALSELFAAATETPSTPQIHPWTTKSGDVRTIEWRCFRLPGSDLVVGMGHDVTDRQRAEERRATQLWVTRVLTHAGTLETAMHQLLRALCEGLDWTLGEVWRVDRRLQRLELASTWYAEDAGVEDFVAASHEVVFQRGDNLPGEAWETGQPIWAELAHTPTFMRAPIAAKVGLTIGVAFPVVSAGDAKAVIILYRKRLSPPDPALIAMLGDVGGQVAQFLERTEAERQAEAARRRLGFLADASTVLALSIDYETTLRSVAELAVPDLADWCVVDITGDDGSIRRLAVAHRDPEKADLVREADIERFGPVNVIRTGEAELCVRVTEGKLATLARDDAHAGVLRRLGLTSYMCVPLQAADRTFGTLTFGIGSSDREFTSAELALAKDLARRAALALDNARLYRAAQDANRVKDDFLAMLSHELRSPLTSVLSWARLLRARRLDAAATGRGLETIERNAALQVQMIDDLLDVSRIMNRTLVLDPRPVALRPIVDAVLNAVGPSAEVKGVKLVTVVDPELGAILGDPVRLQQIVWNLVSNAIKFTPSGGRIEISLERAGMWARITVRDTGRGITADFLPHVFEPFRQGDRSTTRGQRGLGLGLAIAHELVTLHRGTIRAESAGAGSGATFTVDLPLARTEDKTPIGSADRERRLDDQPDLDKVRVLLVDDDADTLEILALCLREFGAIVATAEAAYPALAAIEAMDHDVLVLDIAMPDEDGYTLIRRARERLTARERVVPAIALTAYAGPEHRERALASGFDAHLAKPIDGIRLAQLIADLLGRRSA